ncbi:MAG TPA: phosphoribosylamine--glycine ligase [Acidobacteriota bacterium]|nr:phosphoribosylamine--glycine ligase [Acidobacteriota bacterium]
MKVLIVGSGGREHALAWKLKQSKKVRAIFCAPGNGGMSLAGRCLNIPADNVRDLADFAQRKKIELTVVGPEQPLAMGIVDEFHRRKLKIFGPEKRAAQIEASKVFAKQFMQKYHIPTAPFKVFETSTEAVGFCKSLEYPAVIKADGLTAGKGVFVVGSFEEAARTVEAIMVDQRFGKAGARVVVESFLNGQEVSVMAITDGKTILPLLPSQDHKQAYEGDKGPNTGGMGAYCPTSFLDSALMQDVYDHILSPTITGLRNENITYQGVLYAGLMITASGPRVLEFNCRFGDPETQAVLPLLKTDLAEVLAKAVDRKLGSLDRLEWRSGAAACVVMASKGYPGKYKTGLRISGLQNYWNNSSFAFHSGTTKEGNKWLTAGGRVLSVIGLDKDLKGALGRAYEQIKRIRFEGAFFRRDIGFRAFKKGNRQN